MSAATEPAEPTEPTERPGENASDARNEQLAAGLAAVRSRIADACRAAGRDPGELTLVVVTKYFPASDVIALARLGVGDVGENRDQEAAGKTEQVRELLAGQEPAPPRLHFIGQLQTNKAASVARYAAVVHSLDRAKLARALDKGARGADRVLDVLLQINLDPDPEAARGRGGVPPAQAAELAELVDGCANLRLRGVMGVAPLVEQPSQSASQPPSQPSDGVVGAESGADRVAREAFERLRAVAAELARGREGVDSVSAGMSADLEQAIAAGATHLRVGSAILGARPVRG
ncbi:YggS family pyridoxal phosphate enzyme [Piscicoccus intestinalis]|uniref:YggS family pyridoxal phosphate enzyme n=1 Tax=Piscicoccus intestinalis TaxID=746033 RepID=UPI000A01736B|nr:YggS family pyridoxal phosphate enzyme [Piscicoccus intestinalis]